MCSEYVSTDASAVCFALQPKGKGKLRSSQMCHQGLDLHALSMLCSPAVVWVSSGAQEETRFQISAELSSPSLEYITGNKKCSGVLSGREGN